MRRKYDVFFIDPQSYSNLALYDYNLLKNNDTLRIFFLGNCLYTGKEIKNVSFRPLFCYSGYSSSFRKSLSYFHSLLILWWLVVKCRPRLIHIQWLKLWLLDYLFLCSIKFFFGCRVVFTAHNVLPHDTGNRLFRKYRRYYHKTDAVITHSEHTKKELCSCFRLPEEKVYVIPHGVLHYELSAETINAYKTRFKQKFCLEDTIVFATLGMQSFYKGTDLIIKVWSETPGLRDNDELRLFIIGKNKGIDYSSVLSCRNVCIIDDFVSDEEFVSLLQLTDVVLMPYRNISQSGVLFSAISESIPFLVTDVGGLTEPLKIADVGWQIPYADCDLLQEAISVLTRQPEKIRKKKEDAVAWKKLRDYYAWDNIAKKNFGLYQKMINHTL